MTNIIAIPTDSAETSQAFWERFKGISETALRFGLCDWPINPDPSGAREFSSLDEADAPDHEIAMRA